MAERLFEDFQAVTTEAWRAQIEKDLKGAPMSKLDWENNSGIKLGVIYRQEDLPEGTDSAFPGNGDMRRGSSPWMFSEKPWEICIELPVADVGIAAAVLENLEHAPDAVRFVLPEPVRSGVLFPNPSAPSTQIGPQNISDWKRLLKPALDRGMKLHFDLRQGFLGHYAAISAALTQLQAAPDQVSATGFAGPLDALGLAELGTGTSNAMLSDGEAVFLHARQHWPASRPILVDLQQHSLAGANAVHELAYSLAMAAEYVAQYAQSGLQPADIFKAISFRFPISTDFFGEIAKFRAFRMLWAKFLRAYQLDPSDPAFAQVNATGSRRQMASLDIPTNILRSSTQAMSAVLGGCDSVSVPAFDELTAAPNSLSMRLSANLQRVLRFEAAFDKVIDPAGGAYFVELLTEQLAAKSWAHFQTMESAGGYLAYLQGGTLRTELQAASNALHSQINKGRVTLLGVNQYPVLDNVAVERAQETPLGELNSESAWATALGMEKANRVQALQSLLEMEQGPLSGLWPVMRNAGRVAEEPEIGERDSSDIEDLRAMTQQLASPPKAFLFTFGDLAMRQARAGFARNLLGTAGIAAKLNAFPDDTAQAMAAAIALKPDIVVLCSADAQYFSDAPVLLQQLKSALPDCRVVLAGKPECWENLRGDGLDSCIFMGMDRLAWLKEVVNEMKLKKGATHAS